ncbi:MAG: heavy metal-binding domain-containing protein [Bacteroidota bacterium]|nr:hypothetical protein [Bacteroidota bacterium]
MNKRIITTLTTLAVMLLTVGIITGQEKMDHKKMGDTTKKSCCSSANKDSSSCVDKSKSPDMQSVDVKAIDKNKDGKVYQCQMCPQQLTDEPGKCPHCEMDLKEVSIEDAQKSLEKKSNNMMDHSKMDGHKMDHSKMMNHDMMNMDHNKMDMKKDNIVREGEIDLTSIDKNTDGKVFQDQMDWNVIADEAGECPVCGMKLKEVTLEKAKENLIKNNFKVKNHVE